MRESLVSLLDACSAAWTKRDWIQLENTSRALLLRASGLQLETSVITDAARWYLGSLLGPGRVIASDRDVSDVLAIQRKLAQLDNWIEGEPRLVTTVAPSRGFLGEILVLATDDSAVSRGRTASLLRKVARPDLAISVSDELLGRSRLNYYALANKGAAMADLGDLDNAIALLSSALRPFHPADGFDRPLNAISRAYRLRFSRDGDLEDLEWSYAYARASWITFPSEFSARTYVAAAGEMGDDEKLEAEAATANVPTSPPPPDPRAIERALQILERHMATMEDTAQNEMSDSQYNASEFEESRTHPSRAGLPWAQSETEALLTSFSRGQSIEQLANKHQRTRGAIQSRLRQQGVLK